MSLVERVHALPVWSAPTRAGAALVVVAHPDDETLALGAPVDALLRADWEVDDHAGAGTAAVAAATAAGIPTLGAPLWAMLWWDHDDPRMPGPDAARCPVDAARCPVDAAAASRRQRALAAHVSQVRGFGGRPPVVTAELIDVLVTADAVVVPS